MKRNPYPTERSQKMIKYAIYYGDREFAREMGDPILTVVEAPDPQCARMLAQKQGVGQAGAGLWAAPCLPDDSRAS